jgi:hypothetical protein
VIKTPALTILILMMVTCSFAGEVTDPVNKAYIRKLNRVSGVISSELIRRGIKTVRVEDLSGYQGRHYASGKRISDEFSRQMAYHGSKNFSVVNNGAEAVIKGTLIPFKESRKWRLQIKVLKSGSEEIITSYSGILETRKSKK